MKSLEITNLIGCPMRCSYCPQNKLIGRYEGKITMTLEDFKLYLSNVPKDVRIDFSGFVENFTNPECTEMIEYANEQGFKIAIYTTLFNFTDEIIKRLEKIDFEIFCVHIKKTTNDEILNKIKNSSIRASFAGVGDDIKDVENLNRLKVISRAGNNFKSKEKIGELRCSRSNFEGNVVLPNGDVYLCCMDYGLQHFLGSLKTTNYNNLNRKGSYNLCSRCECSVLK